MAEDSLADGSSSFNRFSPISPFDSPRLVLRLEELSDEFIHHLTQARALLAVGRHGLSQCSEAEQCCYLDNIDDIIERTIAGFEEAVDDCRQMANDEISKAPE